VKNILDAPFIKEICEITDNMYRLGWDERNGGNISCSLNECVVKEYIDITKVIRTIPINFDAKELSGKYFIVTGTGEYFRQISANPENGLGIIRISADGYHAELVWGYKKGGKFTSELPSHLMAHMTRLKIDPEHRVVMHSHPTNLLAMTQVHTLDEKEFTKSLWKTITECIVVFPDGIGVLPWMLCGTNEIGVATANKMKQYRLVVWALHGIYGVGSSIDEAFGLIETVEKAAELYLKTAHLPKLNTITDEQLMEVVKGFKVDYKKEFFK
jgi:rhamnulose-1-phosphate aldolase